MQRFVLCGLLLGTLLAGGAPAPLPKYGDPRAAYLAYIEAVRKNDRKAARACWVIDDENKSGALDVIACVWISMRQLAQVAEKKFGEEGARVSPGGWRRDDVKDKALDLAKKRVGGARLKVDGDVAELKIQWEEGDSSAFLFIDDPIPFRKVGGGWKIDANKFAGVARGADIFEGAWGRMFRDQMLMMDEAIARVEQGKLKTAKELGVFIQDKRAAIRKKYDEEMKKHTKGK